MATWAVQSLCDDVLYSMENKMGISLTCKLLEVRISAFRVAAHTETTAHTQTIAQHITVDMVHMVLVRFSMHSLWGPFKDFRSSHSHGLEIKIASSVSFACTPVLLSMQKKPVPYSQRACYFMFFLLAKILAAVFNECNTAILTLLSSVNSKNNIIES